MMRVLLIVLLAALVNPVRAQVVIAQSGNVTVRSVTLNSSTPTQVLPVPSLARTYYLIYNVGATGTAWCSESDPNPAPNKAGSLPYAPVSSAAYSTSREFLPSYGFILQTPLWCIADSTGSATLTVETSP